MAVEFISYGYDTAPGEGLGELTWQEMFPQIGSATYAVRSATDWKVSAVSGADRTVSIAAGRGFGLGVIDKTVANETIQLDPIASGSRWDLIVCRRDPTPTKGVSACTKVNGGATSTIPGGRLVGPGIHDQPLALVQVTAGQTQPTNIIDLRTWAGDGGGLVAAHDLVRDYLNTPGTRLYVASTGIDWVRRVGTNDTNEWAQVSPGTWEFSRIAGGTPFTGSQNLAEGTITAAPAGLYLIQGHACLRSAGGATGHVFVRAGNFTDPVRWELDAKFQSPPAATVYRHGGGNLLVAVGYTTQSGTPEVVAPSTGTTKVRAVFLG